MLWPAEFAEFSTANEPLAPYTHLKVGGPVEHFVQPRTVAELVAVLRHCATGKVPLRVLGAGVNLLVRDEPLPGVVMRLSARPLRPFRSTGRGCGPAVGRRYRP